MPTLQELTLAHSQRLSDVYRTRDVRLGEAQASRDLQLRAIAAAARAYQKYDDELAAAREKQLATEAKAEAARASTLISEFDRRADVLADAQLARRSADVEAVTQKRRLEDAAEAKYLAALSSARHLPDAQRSKALQEADRARRLELDQAKHTHDDGLTSSQQQYRAAVDEAVLGEQRAGRDGERAYLETLRFGEAAAWAAKTAAHQTLLEALSEIEEARAILGRWREQLSVITNETAEAEKEEFSRFRSELQEIKVRSASS
jgi:hypothetical protein